MDSSLIKLQASEMQLYLKKTPTQVISCEIFRSILFYGTSPVAASKGFRFPACNFIKRKTPDKMLFCEFSKISKTIFFFDRPPPDDYFLCLSFNFETFF